MDESIDKKVLEESSSDFSILSLFFQADLVVKIVIILLIFSSIWSWAIIFSKYTSLKNILLETEEFEENFYGSETLSKLSKKLGSQPTHPIEAVFFSAMESHLAKQRRMLECAICLELYRRSLHGFNKIFDRNIHPPTYF